MATPNFFPGFFYSMAEAERAKEGQKESPVHAALGHPAAFLIVAPLLHVLLLLLSSWLDPSSIYVTYAYVPLAFLAPVAYACLFGGTVWIENTVAVECEASLATCSDFLREGRNLMQAREPRVKCSA